MKFRIVIAAAFFIFIALAVNDARAEPPPSEHPFCKPQLNPDGTEDVICRNDYGKLNEVASIFAMRPIVVNCYTDKAWEENYYFYAAWGVTFLDPWFSSIEMPELLCQELIGLTEQKVPEVRWRAALAVIVIVHESYHSRLWAWRKSEGKVQCRTIRHFRVGLGLLWGYDYYDLYRDLWPWALAFHYRQQVKFPEYSYKPCRVPYP